MLTAAGILGTLPAAEVKIPVANQSGIDWKPDTEVYSVALGEILAPAELREIRSASVSLNGKPVASQIDDLNFSGSVDEADELCFRIPEALVRGASLMFDVKFSDQASEDAEESFTLKPLGNFIKAESELYTAVFTKDSGALNTLYLNGEPKKTLVKAGLHSPAFSFVGGFPGTDGKQVWKDRLMSWEYKGEFKGMTSGPVRAAIVFDDIAYRAKNELAADDKYRLQYFLYPNGRIMERFSVKPGTKSKNTSYQMIFLSLPLALPEQASFRKLTAGNMEGDVLESVDIPEKGDFSYQRPLNTVLSYLAASTEDAGAAIIVDPKSFRFGKREMNSSDSQYGWNYIGDYRRGQYAWRSDPWSGWQFNLEMSASEWPSRIGRGESPLETYFYVWNGNGELEYTAKALQKK